MKPEQLVLPFPNGMIQSGILKLGDEIMAAKKKAAKKAPAKKKAVAKKKKK